jgi:hypothetical protein
MFTAFRDVFAVLMTIAFIAGMFTMLSRDLLTYNIIQAINTDFHIESGNKKYINNFLQGGNFSIEYSKDEIKISRGSTFSKNICKEAYLGIDSDIIDVSESERFVKEKCSKFEGQNSFIIMTKLYMQKETKLVGLTTEE